jgi:hypothetical protein
MILLFYFLLTPFAKHPIRARAGEGPEVRYKKKRAAKSDSLTTKSRNTLPQDSEAGYSFTLGMPIHWAEFYNDSGKCQEGKIH